MSEQNLSTPLSGDLATLVKRYVGSLYALAEQEEGIDTVASDLRNLRRLWSESTEWRFVASDPRMETVALVQAAEEVTKISAISPLSGKFLAVLAQNRRLNLLPQLVEGFLNLMATNRGEYHADIRIAAPLTAVQQESLQASLTAISGGKVHMNIIEDSSILGGLTIKLGSQFIDASVKTKLDYLERVLKGAA